MYFEHLPISRRLYVNYPCLRPKQLYSPRSNVLPASSATGRLSQLFEGGGVYCVAGAYFVFFSNGMRFLRTMLVFAENRVPVLLIRAWRLLALLRYPGVTGNLHMSVVGRCTKISGNLDRVTYDIPW